MPPASSPCLLRAPSSWASEGRVPGPCFCGRRKAPSGPCNLPVQLLCNAARAWFPPSPHGHPTRLWRRGGETKTRGKERQDPQGSGRRTSAPTRSQPWLRTAGRPGQTAVPSPGAGTYLRGSCREGRRGSARIPGLIVLPLSPYPSIQLGLLPLASPWKKSSEEEKRKINHAAEKGQPRSAGGSCEPGGSVPLGCGRAGGAPPSLRAPPSPSITRSLPMSARPCHPRRRAARPLALGFQRGGGGAGEAGRGPRLHNC